MTEPIKSNLISIITPCYNAAEFLELTYACLKAQTFSNWEWIIYDDLSTDNSLSILQNLEKLDNRVKVFQNSKNSGAATTRNNCLDKAKGEFLAFLDSDDVWKVDKLEKQVHFINKFNQDFIYSNYEMIDSHGNFIKKMFTPKQVTKTDLLKHNPFATSSVFIRRKAVEQHSIRFLDHLRRRQDYLFWYDVIKSNQKAMGMDEFLTQYRITGESSLSSNKKKMAIIQWGLYRNEFKLGFLASLYYFTHYAIHGIKKYFFR